MMEILHTLSSKLQALVRLGDEFIDACIDGDAARARAKLVHSRGVRAEVARVQGALDGAAPETSEGMLLLAGVRELADRVRRTDDAVRLFIERPLPPVDELLASDEGAAAATDALVPATWDYTADLVLLAGAGLEPIARELGRQGQRRIVAYVPGGAEHAYPREVVVAETLDQLTAAALQLSPNPPARIVSQRLPCSAVDAGEHAEAIARIEEALTEVRVHLNTVNSFARTWIAQGLANLPSVAAWPTVGSLADTFRGVPMVIVAPGPSLAGNIDQLHQLKGKALLVTFSHTMKPLAAAGVVPDLILCVDPQDVRYHFDGVDLTGVGAVVNGVTVHPELFDLGAPRYITFAANSALDNWVYDGFGEQARVTAGGSVATSACALGLQWGCDPIVLVGLDLSFPDGRYYIDTSCDGGTEVEWSTDGDALVVKGWSEGFRNLHMVRGARESRVEQVVRLPGYHGGEVRSNFMFSLFHRWFEERAREHPGRLKNCTEGGARIDGTEQMPLADAIARFMTRPLDAGAGLEAAVASVDREARRRVSRRRVQRMLDSVDSCAALARRCLILVDRASATDRPGVRTEPDPGALAALEVKERALAAAMKPVLFLSMLRQREIAEAIAGAQSSTSVADNLAAARRLFETIRDECEWLRPQLSAAARRLATR